MFIVSVKLSPKRMFLSALALVLVVTLGVASAKYFAPENNILPAAKAATGEDAEKKAEKKTEKADKAAEKETEKKAPQKVDKKKTAAKTNDQRVAFIQSFGWEIETEPVEVMEVIIPKEFDALYKEYNSIQKLQGCDLSSYAGKRCKRYSYAVTNYPEKAENVRVNLLVINNKIVGGDVCSLDAGGFMHGFSI